MGNGRESCMVIGRTDLLSLLRRNEKLFESEGRLKESCGSGSGNLLLVRLDTYGVVSESHHHCPPLAIVHFGELQWWLLHTLYRK